MTNHKPVKPPLQHAPNSIQTILSLVRTTLSLLTYCLPTTTYKTKCSITEYTTEHEQQNSQRLKVLMILFSTHKYVQRDHPESQLTTAFALYDGTNYKHFTGTFQTYRGWVLQAGNQSLTQIFSNKILRSCRWSFCTVRNEWGLEISLARCRSLFKECMSQFT